MLNMSMNKEYNKVIESYPEPFFGSYGKKHNESRRCALCGAKDDTVVKIHKCFDFICLCSNCLGYIETLPVQGKNSIVTFLQGAAVC